ncbi:MAG TPA: C4-type zinc ribbon domain-containing protein [Vicinamibacterales bacterium]|nr:C4-type zinc ribbon domain-containing protein [Vicinamibacterales bacterium]
MSPDLQRLIKLQQLESTIADGRATIATHPQRLADADARLNESKQAVETAKSRLKDNQEARRNLEKDVAVYQGRLTKFKDQLSLVKTNKEYQAMQHEIATAQSDLGAVEEKVLERMLEADTIAADLKRAETALATRQKEIDAEKKELTEELASVETSLKEASEARAELVKGLDARLMAIFEQVARVRKGVAISTATRDGLCSACHVRLRPFVFQQIRQNDAIIQCESCQRILYWIPPPPPIEHAVVHT